MCHLAHSYKFQSNLTTGGAVKDDEPDAIPLVYVWFNGKPDKSNGTCGAQWDGAKDAYPNYFLSVLEVTARTVPKVVLITDVRLKDGAFKTIPSNLHPKIEFVDLLCQLDNDYWHFDQLYQDEVARGVQGLAEPWERLNFLRHFVVQSWMAKSNVAFAAQSDADNVVLLPPKLPQGCDSVLIWEPAMVPRPLYWAAWSGAGNVISKVYLDDFTQFMLKVYSEPKYQKILELKASNAPFLCDMSLVYLYVMASLDKDSKPLSNGRPWPEDKVDKNVVLPATKNLKVCNGFEPLDGFVYDANKAFNGGNDHTFAGDFKLTVKDKYVEASKGGFPLANIHFQGGSKDKVKEVFSSLLELRPR